MHICPETDADARLKTRLHQSGQNYGDGGLLQSQTVKVRGEKIVIRNPELQNECNIGTPFPKPCVLLHPGIPG